MIECRRLCCRPVLLVSLAIAEVKLLAKRLWMLGQRDANPTSTSVARTAAWRTHIAGKKKLMVLPRTR